MSKGRYAKKGKNGWYYENFTVPGLPRFRRALKTRDEKTAEIIASERHKREFLRQSGLLPEPDPEPEPGLEEVTLSGAFGRYWNEHGARLPSAVEIDKMSKTMLGHFGKEKPLHEIDTAALSGFVAFLQARGTVAYAERRDLAARSINSHLVHMRAVMNRARDLWGCKVAKIQWTGKPGHPGLFLAEPAPPTRIIETVEEEVAISDTLDEDMRALFDFSLATGVRRENAIGLRKARVHWERRQIELRIKSKTPGGEVHFIDITPRVEAILRRVWNQHPIFVFSFACLKSRSWIDAAGRRQRQVKGQRYPFTPSVVMKRWNEARQATGMLDLNWHRLRATTITTKLEVTGDPKGVQLTIGHRSLATTLRYQRVSPENIKAIAAAGDADREQQLEALKRKRAGQAESIEAAAMPKKDIA